MQEGLLWGLALSSVGFIQIVVHHRLYYLTMFVPVFLAQKHLKDQADRSLTRNVAASTAGAAAAVEAGNALAEGHRRRALLPSAHEIAAAIHPRAELL